MVKINVGLFKPIKTISMVFFTTLKTLTFIALKSFLLKVGNLWLNVFPYIWISRVPRNVSKPIRAAHFHSTVKKAAVKAVPSTNATDLSKLNAQKGLSKRLSRSDGAIHLVPRQAAKKKLEYFPICRKRSLSESDLRPRKKKLATTPMCLK